MMNVITCLMPLGNMPAEGFEGPPAGTSAEKSSGASVLFDWLEAAGNEAEAQPAPGEAAGFGLVAFGVGRGGPDPEVAVSPMTLDIEWPDSGDGDARFGADLWGGPEFERLRAVLDGWFGTLGVDPVPIWRSGERGARQLHGIVLATPDGLEDLNAEVDRFHEAGWILDGMDGEVGGRGLREISVAALLGASSMLAGSGQLDAAEPAKLVQVDEEQAQFRIDDEFLETTKDSESSSTSFVIDLAAQKAYLIIDEKIAVETRVCTGRRGKRTPTGTFTIMEKVRKGKISSIYKVPLPYWMRLTWRGIGIHVGPIKDNPASAGCIRLPEGVASTLFDHMPQGTEVQIVENFKLPGPIAMHAP
jgi:hypothetical protein